MQLTSLKLTIPKPTRRLLFAPLLMVPLLATPVRAIPIDETPPTEQMINDLEQRAEQARPQEQCFFYAELVHKSTELAGMQMLAGDTEHATATLHRVERYADRIHMEMSNDSKRLKNAELLMHHTTLRLNSYVNSASVDDRVILQSTLKRLDQVQSELMMAVFRH